MDLIEAKEGKTGFFVPRHELGSAFPPGTAPVFFNPRMELNRDATVLLLSILQPRSYLDAMGGTGVRGLRVACECEIPVTINDRNTTSVDLIRRNVAYSGMPIEVVQEDVNVLLSSRRFDAVDLDPFGTPAPFVDAGARSARRYLFLTATDTAPLCGAHRRAGMRRYFALPMNTEYHAEVGLRTLLAFAVREVVKYDLGVEPLFCYMREHFVRLHLRLTKGAGPGDQTLERIGFILQCPDCPNRKEVRGLVSGHAECGYCHREMIPVGPLWLGKIQDMELLDRMRDRIPAMVLGTGILLDRLLATCRAELDTSSFYDYHQLAKQRGISPPPVKTLIDNLREAGFRASRAHYAGTALKTDALLPEIYAALDARQTRA